MPTLVVIGKSGKPYIVSAGGVRKSTYVFDDPRTACVKGFEVSVVLTTMFEHGMYWTIAKGETMGYANGSWRRMLVAQPPCAIKGSVPSLSSMLGSGGWADGSRKVEDLCDEMTCFDSEPMLIYLG
ncbi:hypothetical protein LTR85_001433 [Meristemomyces frigidus]|nr:hypothetical protein LTR85_001433 [Meristemomyces frigidus]